MSGMMVDQLDLQLYERFGMRHMPGSKPDFRNGFLVAGTVFSAAEISVLDGVTAGTVSASKALVAGASSELTGLGTLTFADAKNIVFNTTTGTKIGTAVGQKIGFWNATPVVQQASAAQAAVTPSTDFTGADTVNKATVLAAVQAVETLVNRIRLDLVTTGILKGSA